ncbi:MAG TPA: CehA/McbA family metallohydrolase [Chryseolinea sp.]|nr:CehA/McbA family metallohydrolase [Chryseolinea sp.]
MADKELNLQFTAKSNVSAQTLNIRQYDVKQNWQVLINDHEIGRLVIDEKDMSTYFAIPGNILKDGMNTLLIKCEPAEPDDILIREIVLDSRPLTEVLAEATVDITVMDKRSRLLLPSRITIVNERGSLQTIYATSDSSLAVRPGCVYSNGKAAIQLPAGTYTIYAGRGFEYGIDSAKVTMKPGDHLKQPLFIGREVETPGWVVSDTHIHTFTHSRHGDATQEERAITIAGEGIELPIMTDHNVNIDLRPVVNALNLTNDFTPVTGDEVTTRVGHFNVFETKANVPVIAHESVNWNDLSKTFGDLSKSKVIILNHARDIHNNFRPFDPSRHLSFAGECVDDGNFPANAMEVINSGSQQTDYMALYRDWFGMLNSGHLLTPVGSSDSHDVNRFIVGQGRTYIQCDDREPGKIDVDAAIKSFRGGRVMVSCGLLTRMSVNNVYGPGDVVPGAGSVNVVVDVMGPAWVRADRVALYANGKKIREEKIVSHGQGGIKLTRSWTVTIPKHDVYLVAIADGPGNGMPYWPIAKPFQPAGPDWNPKVIGSTGAVWVDGDRNNLINSPRSYAEKIITSTGGDMSKIVRELGAYDEAVAGQVAALLWKKGTNLNAPPITTALKTASPATKEGFKTVIEEITKIGNHQTKK